MTDTEVIDSYGTLIYEAQLADIKIDRRGSLLVLRLPKSSDGVPFETIREARAFVDGYRCALGK